ncbi:MAG: hypothetical protein ACOYNR_16190 [Blastocatellia bacterium]
MKEKIEKVVNRLRLDDPDSVLQDLAYWLSKTPAERVAAVDLLRQQYYGNSARLQRVARVVHRPPR